MTNRVRATLILQTIAFGILVLTFAAAGLLPVPPRNGYSGRAHGG